MDYRTATIALQAADDAWSAELVRVFGRRAGEMRYVPAGKNAEGSQLRRLHDAFTAARLVWEPLRPSARGPRVK